MFYRYISENFTAYINQGEIEAGNTDFDYVKMSDSTGVCLVKDQAFLVDIL